MKKLSALLLLMAATASISYAQNPLEKVKTAAPAAQTAPKLDVGSTANSILGKLTPALGLSETQKPGVLGAVTGFLKGKSGIMGWRTRTKPRMRPNSRVCRAGCSGS